MEDNSVTVLSTHIRMMVGIRYKVRNQKRTGKKKSAIEGLNSFSYSRDQKKLVSHIRHIDRLANQYFELIIDPESGETIHQDGSKDGAYVVEPSNPGPYYNLARAYFGLPPAVKRNA